MAVTDKGFYLDVFNAIAFNDVLLKNIPELIISTNFKIAIANIGSLVDYKNNPNFNYASFSDIPVANGEQLLNYMVHQLCCHICAIGLQDGDGAFGQVVNTEDGQFKTNYKALEPNNAVEAEYMSTKYGRQYLANLANYNRKFSKGFIRGFTGAGT